MQNKPKKETPNIKTQCIKWCEKFKSPDSLLVNKKLYRMRPCLDSGPSVEFYPEGFWRSEQRAKRSSLLGLTAIWVGLLCACRRRWIRSLIPHWWNYLQNLLCLQSPVLLNSVLLRQWVLYVRELIQEHTVWVCCYTVLMLMKLWVMSGDTSLSHLFL